MRQLPDKSTEVLIVGAGPTGLMMACQLAVHQVPFRIIDKKNSPSNNSGALILQARSLEIFEQMGIAGEALNEGIIADKVNIVYLGKTITSTSIKDIGENLSQFPFLLMLEQSKTEKLLIKFLSGHGHSVERGMQFKTLTRDSEGVNSVVILPDESEQTIKSEYIIAADGGNSTIRDMLKIPFIGKTYPKPIFIMDCKAKSDFSPGEINFVFSKSSVAGFFPLQGSRWRIDGSLPKETESMDKVTFDTIVNLPLWAEMNFIPAGNEWFSVSYGRQKYAGSIRSGKCFLAGDAAHVNTPVGAQGMNTGLQDAFNLAWKLAYVIKRLAKPELLYTYPTERSGISKSFARYADVVFKLFTSKNIAVEFFRLYVLRLFFETVFPFVDKRTSVRQRFFKSISQIEINYRDSLLSFSNPREAFLNDAPRPGDRLPYVEFSFNDEKTNNYKILDAVCFNLVVLASDVPDEIREIAEKYNLAMVLIPKLPETKKLFAKLGITQSGYYLIRPDMHIALCSTAMDTDILISYMHRILMDPHLI